jgi:hypothetical protein
MLILKIQELKILYLGLPLGPVVPPAVTAFPARTGPLAAFKMM